MDAGNQNQLNNLVTYQQIMVQIATPEVAAIMTDPIAVDAYVKDKLNVPDYLNTSKEKRDEGLQAIKSAVQAQQAQGQAAQQAQPTNQPQAVNPTQLTQSGTAQRQGFGV